MDIISISNLPEPSGGLVKFLEFLLSSRLQHILLPIKIVFILFTVFELCTIFYFAVYTDYLYYLWFEDFDELREWKKKYKKPKSLKRPKKIKSKIMFGKFSNILISPKKKRNRKKVERVQEKIIKGKKIDYKLAILDIDRMLNQELERRGVKGRNLYEKIENIDRGTLKNIEELREAREIINEMLRGKREVEKEEAERILAVYKKALSSLRAV
ncbi:hypothetical protein J7K92_00600 [bacterium]|nr:hypothetical protein [bacterium]